MAMILSGYLSLVGLGYAVVADPVSRLEETTCEKPYCVSQLQP